MEYEMESRQESDSGCDDRGDVADGGGMQL
ncbi:MAG: hypothetical protein K0Q59_3908, partial [Paenibacillus sp.]|nr:hypothetical protein [Paenibacillus sp.]